MLNVNELIGFGSNTNILKLIASVSNSSSATIQVPSGVKVGDLLFLHDRENNSSGNPTTVVPSGFTQIHNFTSGTNRTISSWKIATTSDLNATITGMSGTAGNGDKFLLTFGYENDFIRVVTVNQPQAQGTDGTPTNQVKTFAGVVLPVIIVAAYRSSPATGRGFSPSEDGAFVEANSEVRYKIYERNPQDTTISQSDQGNNNQLSSCYFTIG